MPRSLLGPLSSHGQTMIILVDDHFIAVDRLVQSRQLMRLVDAEGRHPQLPGDGPQLKALRPVLFSLNDASIDGPRMA